MERRQSVHQIMTTAIQQLTEQGTENRTAAARQTETDGAAFSGAMRQAAQKTAADTVQPRVITSTETTQPSDGDAASTAVYQTILGSMRTRRISSPEDGEKKQIPVETASLSERTDALQDGAVSGADAGAGSAASASGGTGGAQPSTAELDRIFEEAGSTYHVSPTLLKAVARQESGLTNGLVSSAGAQGIMQLMPGTAQSLGVTDPMDAYQNIMGGARLIRSHLDAYGGNLDLALAAYNAGSGNVEKYGGVPPFAETQNYIASIRESLGLSDNSTDSGQGTETAGVQTQMEAVRDNRTESTENDSAAYAFQPSDLAVLLQMQMMLAAAGQQNTDGNISF